MLSDVGLTLDPLLPTQRDAVTCELEPLLILGAAGTGKTRTLEGRFVWFVEQGSRPERVLLVTPSAARADATRTRLERVLEDGYDELFVIPPVELAALILNGAGPAADALEPVLGPAERFAMLLERIDVCRSRATTSAGAANALLAGFIRRIDRLKAHLIGAEDYARWAERLPESDADIEREFAEVYRAHERMLSEVGARDAGDLIRDALRVARDRPAVAQRFEHVLVDDAHDLDLASATLSRAVAGSRLTAAADRAAGSAAPAPAARRFAGARGSRSSRASACPRRVLRAASAAVAAPFPCEPAAAPAARSRSGAARTSAPRPSRSRPTSSG